MGSYALELCLIGQNQETVHPPCLVNEPPRTLKSPCLRFPLRKTDREKKISKTATELNELDMSKAHKMVMSNFVIKVSLGCHRNTQASYCFQLFILLSMLDSIRGEQRQTRSCPRQAPSSELCMGLRSSAQPYT